MTECKECKKKRSGIQGLIYGLVPHAGCIAFIAASVFGSTLFVQLFKPLLMNRSFFTILLMISGIFATISSTFYLKDNEKLTFDGIKKSWKYLATMYGSTIGVNLVLMLYIFPMFASSPVVVNNQTLQQLKSIRLSVDIPCPGHALLITTELKTINGVEGVQFIQPNIFEVSYNEKTSETTILALEVFKEYPAKVIN